MWLGLVTVAGLASGCQEQHELHLPDWSAKLAFWEKKDDAPVAQTAIKDALVLHDGQLVADKTLPVFGGDFDAAKRLFDQGEFEKAEPIFERIAEHQKNTLQIQESSRFYQGECQYNRRQYPAASDTYTRLLNQFPSAARGKDVRERLYAIANYWLDETRDQMEEQKEVQEGRRWMVMPRQLVHFDDTKPLFDMEGHALKLLDMVHMTDPRGELGEKALFMLGSVKFYREQYRDADHYFYQLVKFHPDGKFAPKALELSIVCKEISTCGPDYDGRKLQEAQELVAMARVSYPELAKNASEFLTKQEVAIRMLQAEKDFNIAKFWDRTGHPGSAYFYYEIVRRRYPGTEFADRSAKRMIELKVRAEQEQARDAPPVPDSRVPANEPGPQPRLAVPADAVAPRALPTAVIEAPRQ